MATPDHYERKRHRAYGIILPRHSVAALDDTWRIDTNCAFLGPTAMHCCSCLKHDKTTYHVWTSTSTKYKNVSIVNQHLHPDSSDSDSKQVKLFNYGFCYWEGSRHNAVIKQCESRPKHGSQRPYVTKTSRKSHFKSFLCLQKLQCWNVGSTEWALCDNQLGSQISSGT